MIAAAGLRAPGGPWGPHVSSCECQLCYFIRLTERDLLLSLHLGINKRSPAGSGSAQLVCEGEIKPANDELIKSRTRVTEQNLVEGSRFFGASVSQFNCDFILIIKSRVLKAFKNKKKSLSSKSVFLPPYKLALKFLVGNFSFCQIVFSLCKF